MKLSDLKPAGYNPRTITDEQIERLKKALHEFGDLSGIVFNRKTGNLVGGHQRLKCLPPDAVVKKEKLKKPSRTGTVAAGTITIDNEAYTYREVDWDEIKEKAANIAANQQGGEFDDEKLALLLKELSEAPDFDMDMLGFDNAEIEQCLSLAMNEGLTDPDEVPEVTEAITKTGDLWLLGSHRLLCGDATKKEDMEKLMDGKKAIITLTDPPYNYDYEYGVYDDNKEIEEYEGFTNKWYQLAKIFSRRILVTPGLKNISFYYRLFNPLWMLVWVKKNAMTGSKIGNLNIWEPILLEEDDYDYEPIIFEGRPKKRVKRDVYEFPVKKQKSVGNHPCPKLFEFWEKLLTDFSDKSNLVLDPFLGSGSTLIACEKTNRICYGMEIDAHYCDIIIKRWEDFTGKKAEMDSR